MTNLRLRLRRAREWLRCSIGVHRLRAWEGDGHSATAYPIDPRGKPGRYAFRRCDWCGASWKGAYDGVSPFWQASRPAFYKPPPIPASVSSPVSTTRSQESATLNPSSRKEPNK